MPTFGNACFVGPMSDAPHAQEPEASPRRLPNYMVLVCTERPNDSLGEVGLLTFLPRPTITPTSPVSNCRLAGGAY